MFALAVVLHAFAIVSALAQSCQETPSDGDRQSGITITYDPSCGNGGIGCLNENCTYCKIFETELSSHLRDCDNIGWKKSLTPLSSSSSSSSFQDSCPRSISSGDYSEGIELIHDAACVDGGLGCLDTHCRFCKFRETLSSSHLESCSQFGYFLQAENVRCQASLSEGDAAAGVGLVTDPTCKDHSGVGCFDDVCRYCQNAISEESKDFQPCSLFAGTNSASASKETESTTKCPNFTSFSQGVSVTEDPSCEENTTSCLSNSCRLCRIHANASIPALSSCATFQDFAFQRASCAYTALYQDQNLAVIPDATCQTQNWNCYSENCRVCQFGPASYGLASCAAFGYAFQPQTL